MAVALSLFLIGHAAALLGNELEWTVVDNYGIDDGWLVAGEGGSLSIKVQNTNGSVTIDTSSEILFDVSDLGEISLNNPSSTEITAAFSPSTESGISNIGVTFSYWNNGTLYTEKFWSDEEYIKIDHNDPVGYVSVDYDDPVTVTQLGNITVKMQDEYGNLVDDRYETDTGGSPESVTFWCTPGSDFGFWDGSAIQNPSYTVPVDADGIVSVQYKVSKYAGANPITADPSCFASPYYFTITSIGESIPDSMTTDVAPSTKEVRADGTSKFYFKYTVYDQYGNPSPYTTLTITTNIGWSTTLRTDVMGVARMSLGPADQIATVNVKVTSPDNPSFTSTTTVWFVDVGATYLSLSANPAQLPSKDVNENSDYESEILAILTDPNGNPSKDQEVTFWFEDVNTTEDHLEEPYIYDPNDPGNHVGVDSTITLTTSWNGEVSVYFVPGKFNAIPVATGRCIIIAEWNGTQRAIEMVWRNEPYLTVETSVNSPNSTLSPCDEIDVEILLKGDGLVNLVTVPVDVMFCIARTERMFDDTYWSGSSGDEEDKIVYAMNLTKNFTLSIEEGLSRFGLVTYGKNGDVTISPSTPTNIIGDDSDNPPDDMDYIAVHYPGYDHYAGTPPRVYSDYATLDQPLDGKPYNDTRDAIDLIMPSTDPNPLLKPDRAGVYLAIKELADSTPVSGTDPVRAVVVMTDNRKWTIYGDPLAGGVLKKGVWSPEINDKWSTDLNDTSRWWKLPEFDADDNRQNLAFYANDNDIMIFAIALRYHDTNVDNDLKTAYTTLAEQTGGEYYEASCGEDILTALIDISNKIKRTAAINASLTLEFVGAPENETGFNYTAGDVFDYVYYGPPYPTNESTVIQHWNWTDHPDHTGEIGSGDIVIRDECIDQSGEYEGDHMLTFDVGTINIKETWKTKFRLKVNCTLNDTFCFNLYGNATKLVGTSEDGSEIPIEFPDQYLCVMGNTTAPPNSTSNFTHGPLSFSLDSQYVLNASWPVQYDGEFNVTEYVYVNEPGKMKGSPETIIVDNTTAICWQRIDLRQFPRATGIKVTVHPSVLFTDLQRTWNLNATSDNYIRIE